MDNPSVATLPAIDRPMAYRWLAGLYSTEITQEMLKTYADNEGQILLNVLSAEPVLEPVVSAIREAAEEPDRYQSLSFDLATSFSYLFLGVGGRYSAPPYQSAYVSKRGTLFQVSAEEMNNILRKLDMSVVSELKEPPDHIAIQLSVMAELADRSVNASSGDRIVGPDLIEQQTTFLDGHLLGWTPMFRDDCILNDKSKFYATLSKATVRFLEKDRGWLGTLENTA